MRYALRAHPEKEESLELLRSDIAFRRCTEESILKLLKKISRAKALDYHDVSLIKKYGFRNLCGANLKSLHLKGSDLRNADLREAQVRDTEFDSCDLSGADLSVVRIANTRFDLTEDELVVPDSAPWSLGRSHHVVGTCYMCEDANRMILRVAHDRPCRYARRGVVLFWRKQPVGFMKLKGEESFLPLRTVRVGEGAVFWKGMVYGLHTKLRRYLCDLSWPYREERYWRCVSVEALARHIPAEWFEATPLRFIRDPRLFDRIDLARERIASGKESLIRMRAKNPVGLKVAGYCG